jgi:hypothetical protein
MTKVKPRPAIEIAGYSIKPGGRQSIDIPLPSFYTHSSVNMPVHVVHGRKPGPVLLVTAAIHGDEITGVELDRDSGGQCLRFRFEVALPAGSTRSEPIVSRLGDRFDGVAPG